MRELGIPSKGVMDCIVENMRRCALQYILLHLLGYKLSMDDLKAFRQINSKTPGHPEAGHTDGAAQCLAANAI
jgi:hypothetical protein